MSPAPSRASSRSSKRLPRRRGAVLAHVAALLAVGLLAAACGGTPGDSGQASAEKPLPGIKEFGLNEEEFTAHVEKTQQLIARCMNDAGFQYIPVDVTTIEAAQLRMRSEPGHTRREYKEKWGLAVTTRFDNPVRDTGLGPNLQIWRSLPKADRQAYSRTLWGDDPNADFVFTMDEEDFSSTGGCTRKAVSQVFTPKQMKGTYVNPKDVLVDSDPRIVEAHKRWSECMHEAGYEYEDDQDEIIEEYEQRLEQLTEGDPPRTLTGTRLEALHRLQEEEIAVSLVDLKCQLKHTDRVYRIVETEIFGQPVSG